MTGQTYANIDDRVVQNVRKALRGSVFFAPTSAPPITAISVNSGALAAPAAPAPTTSTTGGTVAAGTYQVTVTYVSAFGETTPSTSGPVTTTGATSTITVPSPSALAGATGWYAYVSQAAGTAASATRQQAAGSPTAIGTALTLTAPPTSTGPTAPAVDSSGSSTLNVLPAGYKGIGQIDGSGVILGNKVTKSDIQGWGRVVPVRADITAQQRTIQLTALEVNKQSLATYFQVDPASIVPDATTDEVQITEPDSPVAYYWRVLALAVDQNDSGEIYLARFFPYASVTDLTDINFDSDKDAVSFGCTLTAYTDSGLGYSSKFFAGGPGWKALKTGMGF